METETLKEIIKKHQDWLNGLKEGEKANLRLANLSGANLSGADLLVIQLPYYTAYIQKTHTRIWCKHYSNEEWLKFTDEQIEKMDSNALTFWKQFKPVIVSAMESLK